ncbi:MerR family transcriptional regulator [Alteribacillus bidgolensis]|uniref:Transcriptional regulator, MerR family n=1 Tax=Alteribacillus bidgolensis TaxID=930129 RepID=A0A1G8MH21_9BACI|nr:MerR family transcriptional regulator [Alteribacillus bidgolensis]SDI67117.1 transcriptional regulator, MerR family [Alteribacillus bidgolensis]
MKIGELSRKTGASVRSIRHYEKKNLIIPNRLDNGYRDFDESAIDRIKTIQLYLGLGLTTEQIEGILNCKGNNPNPEMDDLCEDLLLTYEEKLAEVNSQMNTLATVKYRLEEQINRFKEKKASHNEQKEINI